jgi:hypothetical protein
MATPGSAWRIAIASVALVSMAACGGNGDDGTAGDDGGNGGNGGTVAVTLREFAVAADVQSIGSGSVTFDATNEGPEDEHELVVVRTDLPLTELPTTEDGAFDEEAADVEVIGEIAEFPVGETRSDTWELEAGSYVLLCNIVQEEDDGTLEAHFAEGMRAPFTVE